MLENNEHTGKRDIQARMHQLAARKLGISHAELLDPIVNLFLESLSEEIYKLTGEIESMEKRILYKLLSMLVPTNQTIAQPAHCILQAFVKESLIEVTTKSGFQYFNREQNRLQSFYPVCDTKIYHGNIIYFIHKGQVYNIGSDLSKTLYFHSWKHTNEENTFWLGIDLDKNIENISGLSFHFDLNGVFDKNRYLNLLSYTTWSLGDKIIPMKRGLSIAKEEFDNVTLDFFFRYNSLAQLNKDVIDHYNNRFLTIAEDFFISDRRELFPKELMPYFSDGNISLMDKPLIWIKIACPQQLGTDIIELIQPAINAFPVLNKELVSTVSEVSHVLPMVPLRTKCNESFLAINRVNDSSGKVYYDIPVYNRNADEHKIYSLRCGGIEAYSKCDANEYLKNTIDALNHEVSSFFKNIDDGKNDLKQMEVEVNNLIGWMNEKMLKTNEYNEVKNYLLFSPGKANETYFVDYWITNGEAANHIRSGSAFLSLSEPVSTYALSQTIGGRYAPPDSDKNILRQDSIVNHKLLITNNDIQKFCMNEFKESVCGVVVCKGFVKSNDPKLGFIETIDVHLKLMDEMKEYVDGKGKEYYLLKLKENSPATFNYRVFIEEKLS